jgi:hypothetical protein
LFRCRGYSASSSCFAVSIELPWAGVVSPCRCIPCTLVTLSIVIKADLFYANSAVFQKTCLWAGIRGVPVSSEPGCHKRWYQSRSGCRTP